MIERFDIAGYARISVDEELDRDNVSIENQKSIIEDFVKTHFLNSTLTFFEAADRCPFGYESGTKLVCSGDLEVIEKACPKGLANALRTGYNDR